MERGVHLHNFSSTDSNDGDGDVGWSNTTIYVYNLINSTTGNDTNSFIQQPPLVIQILGRVYIISVPTIIILGVIGNILAFCIFASKSLRRTSCSIYLAARSFSDSGFLVSLFISWLGDALKIPIIHVTVMCQLVIFTSYFFAFLSVWLVVFITMENYIRICHPFSVAKFCNVQKKYFQTLRSSPRGLISKPTFHIRIERQCIFPHEWMRIRLHRADGLLLPTSMEILTTSVD
ncbi:hypothetical protein C0Q70_21325 [Pomacea canaliculata]|uniref:G-protein coupled receptors family 1 profile domain-containing protein n=1 Tax=Pomacea canaliculata TaxID=400727 RepID=A0A2T7NC72_POMCA|nr:hypothetical protein C0Q70_21325 [Pomacea canaliculata]